MKPLHEPMPEEAGEADAACIQTFVEGRNQEDQTRAFNKLYDRYALSFYSDLRKWGCSDADAKDILQETWYTLLRTNALGSFKPFKGTFITWFTRVLVNKRNELHKRSCAIKRGGGEYQISLDQPDEHGNPYGHSIPDQVVESKADELLLDLLERFEAQLTSSDQAIWDWYKGSVVKEKWNLQNDLAKKLGISVTCFKGRLFRLHKAYNTSVQNWKDRSSESDPRKVRSLNQSYAPASKGKISPSDSMISTKAKTKRQKKGSSK